MKKLSFLFLLFSGYSLSLRAQAADTLKSNVDTTVFVKVEKEAEFPGGEANWNKHVHKFIEQNIDRLVRGKKNYGTCEVQFIVDKDGSLSNIEALTMKNSYLAKVVLKALKESPKWVPARIGDETVKAWRRQKVTLQAPEK